MALTPLWCEGFEHGVASASGSGLASSIGTAQTIVTGGAQRHGTYALQCAPTAAAAGQWVKTLAANAKVFLIFAVKITSAPASQAKLARVPLTSSATAAPGPKLNADGTVTMQLDNASGGDVTTAGSIADGNWHTIAMQVDVSGTTWTVDWWVDGTKQTQAAKSGKAADTAIGWAVGTNVTTGPAYTAVFDDVFMATWATAGTDFITDVEVLGLVPGADGSHNAGTTTFIDGDAATTPNFTNSTTDAYTRLDEIPWTTTRRTTNNISAEVHVNGVYLEIAPVGAASGKPNALGVTSFLEYSSVTATANSGSVTVVRTSAGADTEVFGNFTTGADYSESTNFFKGVLVPKPAAGWSKSEIDAIRWRIGRDSTNTDVNPRPTWQGLLLQVAYEIASGFTIDAQPGSYALTGAVSQLPRGLFINAAPAGYTLTGLAATLSHGFVFNAEPGAYTLAGAAASVVSGRMVNAAPGAYTLAGADATLARGLFLNAQPGSYAIAGEVAGLARGFALDAQPAAYTLTGQVASVVAGRALNAQPTAYTLTGFASGLLAGHVIQGDPAAYTLAGAVASLDYHALSGAFTLDAQPGVFVLSGAAATFVRAIVLVAEPGALAIAGAPAGVVAGRALDAQPAALVVTGVAAAVLAGRIIQAQPGQFAVVGIDGQVVPGRVLQAEPGVFVVTGQAATLLGGVFAQAVHTDRTRSDVRTGRTGRGNGTGRTGHRIRHGRTST